MRQQMSVADLVLEGHTDLAEFALGVSSAEPLVASGGRDTNVRRDRTRNAHFATLSALT